MAEENAEAAVAATAWKDYINHLTTSIPSIKRAAILNAENGEVWARTEGADQFTASADELKTFATQFLDTSTVPNGGVVFEKTHYVVPRVDEHMIFGKHDIYGFFAVKTTKLIIIAIYRGSMLVGNQVLQLLEGIAEHLKTQGY